MLCFIFCSLVVLKHQLYTITSPHTERGQTFSTFSWPGNGLKIHMRNFLTSSQQLICSHVPTLWHSTAFAIIKKHFITFQLVFHSLSHNLVQKSFHSKMIPLLMWACHTFLEKIVQSSRMSSACGWMFIRETRSFKSKVKVSLKSWQTNCTLCVLK